jgi:hypothetical protein
VLNWVSASRSNVIYKSSGSPTFNDGISSSGSLPIGRIFFTCKSINNRFYININLIYFLCNLINTDTCSHNVANNICGKYDHTEEEPTLLTVDNFDH